MAQTNYTEEEAKEKLRLFNCDYMRVIKDYMGIPEKKEEKKGKKTKAETGTKKETTTTSEKKSKHDKELELIENKRRLLKEKIEAIERLISLGYSKKEARDIVEKLELGGEL